MLTTLRRYFASCALDRDRRAASNAPDLAQVHRLLSDDAAAPRSVPSAVLRSRIMDGLRESAPIDSAAPRLRWALPAAACTMIAVAAAVTLLRPHAPTHPATGPGMLAKWIPVPTAPVVRMVSSVDDPLVDQAQKMYDDTRRATRVVVSRVPFIKRGG